MDLLNNLTEWSLSQTGRMEVNPQYFEMGELINEVILLLSDSARLKSIILLKGLLPNTLVADKMYIDGEWRDIAKERGIGFRALRFLDRAISGGSAQERDLEALSERYDR